MSNEIRKEVNHKQSKPILIPFPEEIDLQDDPKEMVLQMAKEVKHLYSEYLNTHQFIIEGRGRQVEMTNEKVKIDFGDSRLIIKPIDK